MDAAEASEAVEAQPPGESSLVRREFPDHGPDRPLAHGVAEEVKRLNQEAVAVLKQRDDRAARELLERAEELARPYGGALLALTEGNLALAHKQGANWVEAEAHLVRALDLEQRMGAEPMAVVTTHLNLCVVLAKLDKHARALEHALSALELTTAHLRVQEGSAAPPALGDYTCLAVAYLNVGLTRERLRRWPEASLAYRQGFEVASRCLGLKHPITQVLGTNCGADLDGYDPMSLLPLPGIRESALRRGPPATKRAPVLQRKAAGPRLGQYVLPSWQPWPPPGASEEERAWYGLAKKPRAPPPALPLVVAPSNPKPARQRTALPDEPPPEPLAEPLPERWMTQSPAEPPEPPPELEPDPPYEELEAPEEFLESPLPQESAPSELPELPRDSLQRRATPGSDDPRDSLLRATPASELPDYPLVIETRSGSRASKHSLEGPGGGPGRTSSLDDAAAGEQAPREPDCPPPLVFVAKRPPPRGEPPPLRRAAPPKQRVYHFVVEEPPPVTYRESAAAARIQTSWERHATRAAERKDLEAVRQRTATKLCAWWRMKLVRHGFLTRMASRIQRSYRGYRSRVLWSAVRDARRLLAEYDGTTPE